MRQYNAMFWDNKIKYIQTYRYFRVILLAELICLKKNEIVSLHSSYNWYKYTNKYKLVVVKRIDCIITTHNKIFMKVPNKQKANLIYVDVN